MAATARHRKALVLSLSLFLLAAGASGRNRENRRLNEDEDDDRRHSREAHLLAIVLGVLSRAPTSRRDLCGNQPVS